MVALTRFSARRRRAAEGDGLRGVLLPPPPLHARGRGEAGFIATSLIRVANFRLLCFSCDFAIPCFASNFQGRRRRQWAFDEFGKFSLSG